MEHTRAFTAFCPNSPVHVRTKQVTGNTWSAEHGHDFWEFTIVRRGRMAQRLNGHDIVVPSPSVILVGPGDVHALKGEGRRGAYFANVAFPRSIMDEVLAFAAALPVQWDRRSPLLVHPVHKAHLASLEQTIVAIGDGVSMSWEVKTLCLKQMVVTVLNCLALQERRVGEERRGEARPTWLVATMDAMRRPDRFVAGVPRMVSLAGVSQEHLTRSMRR